MADTGSILTTLRGAVQPLTGAPADYMPLLDLIGDARFVLIGEASHGTHDFYHERAEITKRLIRDKGFTAVAVEADWPDAYRINRYVRGSGDGATAIDSLSGFERFPTWMWRNTVVLDFIGWLRDYNDNRPAGSAKAGFYGLDLYSMYGSIQAVLQYLDEVNIGQLVRERHDGDAVLIGFTTYTGTGTATSDWDEPAERKRVRPGLSGSYESLFHEVGIPRFWLPLRDGPAAAARRPTWSGPSA